MSRTLHGKFECIYNSKIFLIFFNIELELLLSLEVKQVRLLALIFEHGHKSRTPPSVKKFIDLILEQDLKSSRLLSMKIGVETFPR